MKEGSGETFFLKAKSYCDDDDLNEKIDRAIDRPESVVTRPSKKLKIDASGTDKKLMKDKFAVFIDKEKVAVIKGGDITNVTLPLGKHEIAVRVNSQMTKAFKRTVSVEDNNYKLKIFGGKDKDFIFDLDEI